MLQYRCKLPPLVLFLARRVSFLSKRVLFLSRCVSFLMRITEAFGVWHILRATICQMDGLSKLRLALIIRFIYIEQPSKVRGDIKLFSTEFASFGNTIVSTISFKGKELSSS